MERFRNLPNPLSSGTRCEPGKAYSGALVLHLLHDLDWGGAGGYISLELGEVKP